MSGVSHRRRERDPFCFLVFSRLLFLEAKVLALDQVLDRLCGGFPLTGDSHPRSGFDLPLLSRCWCLRTVFRGWSMVRLFSKIGGSGFGHCSNSLLRNWLGRKIFGSGLSRLCMLEDTVRSELLGSTSSLPDCCRFRGHVPHLPSLSLCLSLYSLRKVCVCPCLRFSGLVEDPLGFWFPISVACDLAMWFLSPLDASSSSSLLMLGWVVVVSVSLELRFRGNI